MKIDIITGNQSDMSEGGKPKRVIGEIFNKDKVIEPSQAEAAAKAQLGADAVMKGWKVEAHNGKVNYYVTMHQNGKKTVVTVDGNTGAYIEQSKATKLPPEPDQGLTNAVRTSYGAMISLWIKNNIKNRESISNDVDSLFHLLGTIDYQRFS